MTRRLSRITSLALAIAAVAAPSARRDRHGRRERPQAPRARPRPSTCAARTPVTRVMPGGPPRSSTTAAPTPAMPRDAGRPAPGRRPAEPRRVRPGARPDRRPCQHQRPRRPSRGAAAVVSAQRRPRGPLRLARRRYRSRRARRPAAGGSAPRSPCGRAAERSAPPDLVHRVAGQRVRCGPSTPNEPARSSARDRRCWYNFSSSRPCLTAPHTPPVLIPPASPVPRVVATRTPPGDFSRRSAAKNRPRPVCRAPVVRRVSSGVNPRSHDDDRDESGGDGGRDPVRHRADRGGGRSCAPLARGVGDRDRRDRGHRAHRSPRARGRARRRPCHADPEAVQARLEPAADRRARRSSRSTAGGSAASTSR